MEAKKISPLPKASMIALVLIAFAVIITIMKQDTNRTLGLIPLAIMIGGIAWMCLDYSKEMDGNVTFGNVFRFGFKGSALIAGIMAFWVLLSITLIFPEAVERGMEAERTRMEARGMSESDIENGMNIGKKIAAPMGTIVAAIIYLVIGALGSLLGALIAKKNPNPQPFQ